jgi:hypothetical protein
MNCGARSIAFVQEAGMIMKRVLTQLILALVVLSLAALIAPPAAHAWDKYGAIAYSRSSGNYGYSIDHRSRGAAESRALDECGRRDCRVMVWFRNACGALATGRGGVYGYGYAGSRGEAEAIALSECSSRGRGCGVVCWACCSR